MADVFSHTDTINLLSNKYIMFLGDSNIRAQYKDLLWLLNYNTLVNPKPLRSKLENNYLGDVLVARSKLHRGRDYEEVRQYIDDRDGIKVEFMFLPRCYSPKLIDLFTNIKKGLKPVPDIIMMNSCLWDLTRWGPNGVPEYKDNMVKLMRLMSDSLPDKCLVIWTTALPTAAQTRGGLIIKQIEFIEPLLRFEVMEANTFARGVVVSHGFDVLDNHYHTRMQMHRRAKDGVHYLPIAVRFMTNLFLTHVSLSWGCPLPRNCSSMLLDKAIVAASQGEHTKEAPVTIPTTGLFSKIHLQSRPPNRTRGLKITFNTNEERVRRQCRLFQDHDNSVDSHAMADYHLPNYQIQFPSSGNFGNYFQDFNPEYQDRFESQTPYYQDRLPTSNNFEGPFRRRNKKGRNKRKGPYHNNRYNYRY